MTWAVGSARNRLAQTSTVSGEVSLQCLKRRKGWRRSRFRCCQATNGNAAEKMPSARTKSATTIKNPIVVPPTNPSLAAHRAVQIGGLILRRPAIQTHME